MRAFAIDFHKNHAIGLFGWIILTAAMLVTIFVTREAILIQWRLDEARDRLTHLQSRLQRNFANKDRPFDSSLAKQAEALHGISQALSTPWLALLGEIEASTNKDVAVLSIQPEASSGAVTIALESRDLSSMLEFLKALNQRTTIRNAFLLSHQIQAQDAQKPIRARIIFEWTGSREPSAAVPNR